MILVEHESEYRCEWTSYSDRCHYAGTISSSTLGTGPWYCHEHFRCNSAITGDAIVRNSERDYPRTDWTVSAVRKRINPPSDPYLQNVSKEQAHVILNDLREMLRRAQINMGVGKGFQNVTPSSDRTTVRTTIRTTIDREREAERAAMQVDGGT